MRNTLFGLDGVSFHDEGQALLCTVYSSPELAVIRGILESAEIPYLLKERGAGSASKVIIGFSICGTDVFVPESAYEEASVLIAPQDGDGTSLEEEEKEEL